MSHEYIDEQNLIDSYIRGDLELAERKDFEEHFLDCQQCLRQLELAKSFRNAIAIYASDKAASAETSSGELRGSPFRLPGRLVERGWAFAGVAACLLVTFLTSVLLYRQLARARLEQHNMQSAFITELNRAEAKALAAQQNPPILYDLSQARSTSEAAKAVEIPREPTWIVFSISVDTSQFQSYRATLQSEAGRAIWQKGDLKPASADTLAVPLLSTLLGPGTYTLIVDARDSTPRYTRISAFFLRAR